MLSDGQRFLDHRAADGALLRSISWVDQYDLLTSLFRFVGGILYQPALIAISNGSCKVMVLDHPRDVQILNTYRAVSLNVFVRQLVQKVTSLSLDFFVCPGYLNPCLVTSATAFLSAGKPALPGPQLPFGLTVKLRVAYFMTVRIYQKRLDPNIQPYDSLRLQ